MSNNTKLTSLFVAENFLNDLDLSKNILLEYLNIEENSLNTLDLSNLKDLKVLYMRNSLDDNFIYLRVNQIYKPSPIINVKLPNHFSFFDSISDKKIINYNDGIIKAIKTGISNYEIYVTRKDGLDNKELANVTEIQVYDLKSSTYTIKGDTIYSNKDELLDTKKIKIVNGNALSLKQEGTTLKVLDGMNNVIEKLNIVYIKTSNPKTADKNIMVYIGIVVSAFVILGISIKKVKTIK